MTRAARPATRRRRGLDSQTATASLKSGAALFSGYCASCHQSSGAGSANQAYPSLFHNTATGAGTAANLVATILYGIDRNVGDQHVLMPRFDQKSYVNPLTNQQVADILRAGELRQSGSAGHARGRSSPAMAAPCRCWRRPSLIWCRAASPSWWCCCFCCWRGGVQASVALEGRLSFYEASIAAAAIGAGCRTLYSEDMSHGQILEDGLTITSLFRAPRP